MKNGAMYCKIEGGFFWGWGRGFLLSNMACFEFYADGDTKHVVTKYV